MTRDEFIRDVKTDPYMAAVQRMYIDAWALGYEAARRDALKGQENDLSYGELRNRAMEEILDRQHHAEAEFVVALAALGRSGKVGL